MQIDTVLVTRLRNSAGSSGVSKEDLKAVKNRLADLETQGNKHKGEIAEMKKKIGDIKKPSKEEQDERRKNVTCHHCGKKGHYKSECPELADGDGKEEKG